MKLMSPSRCLETIRFLLIAVGMSTIAASILVDMVGIGHPGFGLKQLLGLLVGFLLVMVGLLKIHISTDKNRVRILSAIYLCVILFAGLRPRHYRRFHYSGFLKINKLNLPDIFINTLGFIPLGYLLMMSLQTRKRIKSTDLFKRAMIVGIFGTLISLLLETSQYFFIPGRSSSLIDLITNIIGTLTGALLFIFFNRKETESIMK